MEHRHRKKDTPVPASSHHLFVQMKSLMCSNLGEELEVIFSLFDSKENRPIRYHIIFRWNILILHKFCQYTLYVSIQVRNFIFRSKQKIVLIQDNCLLPFEIRFLYLIVCSFLLGLSNTYFSILFTNFSFQLVFFCVGTYIHVCIQNECYFCDPKVIFQYVYFPLS